MLKTGMVHFPSMRSVYAIKAPQMSSKYENIKIEQKLQSLVHNHYNCNNKEQGLIWPFFVLK